jgi:tRNA (adenine22-N1)-methyltransferase
MIKISKRLEAISSLVPVNSNIIDIGCDHALLDIYLYQKKVSNKIIASDINENALNNAKENIKNNKLENYIETRLGNGLDTLNNEDNIDTIIISGMGGHTIIGILKNNLSKLKDINTIIIQSNTKLEFLRREVTKLKYLIEDEIMVEDNKKVYTVIKLIKGKKKYTKKELYFGPILLKKKDKLFIESTKKEFQKLNIYLKLLPKERIMDRYKLKKEIRLYKDIV